MEQRKLKFVERNVNPKGRKTCDCVIRAITTATGRPYNEIYQALYEVSLKTGYMITEKRCYEKVLANYGFYKHPQPRKANGKKYLVCEIKDYISNDLIVISMAKHLTCVVGNELIDLWDCGYKTIGNYYTKGIAKLV